MLKIMQRVATTGSEQSVLVPRANSVMIQCIGCNLQLRTTSGSTEYFTITAGMPYEVHLTTNQTIYLTGTAGSYIEIMLKD